MDSNHNFYIETPQSYNKLCDKKKEEFDEDVEDLEEENLNVSNLFDVMLDMNVSTDKWGC